MTDDYAPVRNAFTGRIAGVCFDLDTEVELGPEVRRRVTTLIND